MSDRDFRAAWRAADRAMADARPSPRLDARVEASLSRVVPRSAMAFAAAAVTVAAIILLQREPPPDPSQPEMVLFTPASCAPTQPSADLHLAPGCRVTLEDPAMSIDARTDVLLRRTLRGIRLLKGTAAFQVAKVTRGPEVVLLVSGGRIEVLGTRFVVNETGASGAVTLEEGRIAFVALDGDRADLSPGGVHRWQRHRAPIAQAPKPPPPTPPPPRSPPPPPRVQIRVQPAPPPPFEEEEENEDLPPALWSVERTGRAVARVSELRARGRWVEAVALIAQLLQAPLDARAAEVLSFERGEILAHKMMKREEACEHWRSHLRRFAGGRYHAEVARSISECAKETLLPFDGE